MSIFGSLGILKAGLITLNLGQDIVVGQLHGPRLLQNAGFAPGGILDLLMYAFDSDDSVLVAEQKIRAILRRRPPAGVVLKPYSAAWTMWYAMMLNLTMTFSGIGIVPYVYIIVHDLRHRPFSSTWIYSLLRVFGSALAVTAMQFAIQFRILAVVRDRSVVEVATHLFKKEGRPALWFRDSAIRAHESLQKLRDHIDVEFATPIVDMGKY